MKLKYIINALNLFISNSHPELKGFFIGKESIEPTRVNAYKAYKVEIYWHLPGKNHPVFTYQMVDRCLSEDKDALKERYSTVLLEQIFTNLNKIENEVIQIGRI